MTSNRLSTLAEVMMKTVQLHAKANGFSTLELIQAMSQYQPKNTGRPMKIKKSSPANKEKSKKRGRPKKERSEQELAIIADKKARAIERAAKPKIVRKSPQLRAKDQEIGYKTTGADGEMWEVAIRPKSGTQYWKRFVNSDSAPKPKAERKSPAIKAKEAGEGTEMEGSDGTTWTVHARNNSGSLYWKRNT